MYCGCPDVFHDGQHFYVEVNCLPMTINKSNLSLHVFQTVLSIWDIGARFKGYKGTGDEQTDRGVSRVSHTGVMLLLLVRCTCFSAGITGMTCREVADTSLSDLAGLAQYCSSRLRSQLRKQHSSTIPRFWVRRLFPLLVGLPEEEQNK